MALENNTNKEEENTLTPETPQTSAPEKKSAVQPKEEPKIQRETQQKEQGIPTSEIKPEQPASKISLVQPTQTSTTPSTTETKSPIAQIPKKEDILLQPEDLSVEGQARAARAKLPPTQQKITPPSTATKEKKILVKQINPLIKSLRTYKSDIAEVLAKGKTSLVGIVTSEHKRKQKKNIDFGKSPQAKNSKEHGNILKNSVKILGSVVFILLGISATTYMYITTRGDATILPTEIFSPVFSEHQKSVDITNFSKRKLSNALLEIKRNTSASLNSITNYQILASGGGEILPISASDFLKMLGVRAPNSFLRSLRPEFMLGIHVFDGNEPFFVFKTLQYEESFAGMLEWEETIERDLSPLFVMGAYPSVSTTSTSTESTTTPPIKEIEIGFRDVVIRNKDTRVLTDGEGNTVLLYSFLNRETIIIVSNTDSFKEILTRISSTRTLK